MASSDATSAPAAHDAGSPADAAPETTIHGADQPADLGALTEDLVSDALSNLTGGGLPLTGEMLDALVEAVTADLVGGALANLGDGAGLPDLGGEHLGAIINHHDSGLDGHGDGIDVGHTLDMLTSTVDLFDVPSVHDVTDGALPA